MVLFCCFLARAVEREKAPSRLKHDASDFVLASMMGRQAVSSHFVGRAIGADWGHSEPTSTLRQFCLDRVLNLIILISGVIGRH